MSTPLTLLRFRVKHLRWGSQAFYTYKTSLILHWRSGGELETENAELNTRAGKLEERNLQLTNRVESLEARQTSERKERERWEQRAKENEREMAHLKTFMVSMEIENEELTRQCR